jgi:hypothetical protein
VSYDAAAKVSQDRELIKAHWNKAQHPGYFGDLKDGKHDGTYNDPRVSIIEIIPDEIRYWVSSKHTLLKTAQVALAAVTGNGTAPGELRIITKAEVNTLDDVTVGMFTDDVYRSSSLRVCRARLEFDLRHMSMSG